MPPMAPLPKNIGRFAQELLKETRIKLRDAQLEDHMKNANQIVGAVLNLHTIERRGWGGVRERPAGLEARFETEIKPSMRKLVDEYVARRISREPLQYIIESWDFHRLRDLRMRKSVLIPRPETEQLVDLVVEDAKAHPKFLAPYRDLDNSVLALLPPPQDGLLFKKGMDAHRERARACVLRMLDVGMGTGALGLALANELRLRARVIGIDSSEDAYELANENTERLFFKGLYEPQLSSIQDFQDCPHQLHYYQSGFDFIVSNPPYIPTSELADMQPEVRDHESHEALFAGHDGLDLAKIILEKAPTLLDKNRGGVLWMELHHTHKASGFPGNYAPWMPSLYKWTWHDDLFGKSRFLRVDFRKEPATTEEYPFVPEADYAKSEEFPQPELPQVNKE